MNTEEFLSAASQIKDVIAFIIPVTISIFALLYVRARAGSAGFIHDRLWRLLGGKKDYQSTMLQNEYSKLSDHEKFNYSTGIRFPSQRKITETLVWLHERGIGLEEVVRVRRFFNPILISIEKPCLLGYRLSHWTTMSFLIGATIIFILSSLPAALLTIKKTDTVIWASTSIVTDWSGYDWQVKEEDCIDGKIEKIKLDPHDEMVICDILTKEENAKPLQSSMQTQKIFGGMFWAIFGFFAFLSIRALVIAKEANSLFERALVHQPLQEQLPF